MAASRADRRAKAAGGTPQAAFALRGMGRRAAAAVVVCGLALGVSACSTGQAEVSDLASVSFRQSQAVPDYDDAEYETHDSERLADLQGLLQEYDWKPGWRQADDESGCVGGTTTELQLVFGDGTEEALEMYACGQGIDQFVEQVSDLVSSWH